MLFVVVRPLLHRTLYEPPVPRRQLVDAEVERRAAGGQLAGVAGQQARRRLRLVDQVHRGGEVRRVVRLETGDVQIAQLRVDALHLEVEVLLQRHRHRIVDAHPPHGRALPGRPAARSALSGREQADSPKTDTAGRHQAGGDGRPGAKTLVKTHHTATPFQSEEIEGL